MADRTIRIGKVSSVDYGSGMIKVTYPDLDNSVTDDLPYLTDLAQAIGEAFLQYSGSSLQIHAPAITLDASRIKLATKSGSITVAEIINHIKG